MTNTPHTQGIPAYLWRHICFQTGSAEISNIGKIMQGNFHKKKTYELQDSDASNWIKHVLQSILQSVSLLRDMASRVQLNSSS